MALIDKSLHDALGARFSIVGDREHVESYGDPAAEHRAVRDRAGVVDRSPRVRLRIEGEDRVAYLQGLLSCDVAGLAPGRGAHGLLLTPKGMLVADLAVYCREELLLVEIALECGEIGTGKLEMYTLSSDVTIVDESAETGLLGVHGPDAGRIVEEVAGVAPPEGALECLQTGEGVLVCRVDYLGEVGFDLHVPVGDLAELLGALLEAGAEPTGRAASETLRIEAGIPRFGAELTDGLLPPEVPLLVERAISYDKGCYLGQETIARVKTYGRVNRELRGIAIEGDRAPDSGAQVSRDGVKAGVVTSACVIPGSDRTVALAFVSRKFNVPGTTVSVEDGYGALSGTVVLSEELR